MKEQGKFENVVIFGGAGFIGQHLALELLQSGRTEKIYLTDIQPIDQEQLTDSLQTAFKQGLIIYINVDVRKKIYDPILPKTADCIINLAAIHKQPGHQEYEYFETNLLGAENVCQWATQVKAKQIIFTSSIAVYGGGNFEKNEESLPTPNSPYGISKLVAEKIHLAWQNSDPQNSLLIVRPGVIFGHGEKGNVSRMVKAVLHHYFFFSGNEQTIKAGGYVKELTKSMLYMLDYQNHSNKKYTLYNFSMSPAPTVKEYVTTIQKVSNVSKLVISVPYSLLLLASYGISMVAKALSIKQPIDPVRVRKLVNSNIIKPKVLLETGYEYSYSLLTALTEWKLEWPNDWK